MEEYPYRCEADKFEHIWIVLYGFCNATYGSDSDAIHSQYRYLQREHHADDGHRHEDEL